MNPKPQLPVPDAISAAHSERVAAHIRSMIDRAGGSVPFSRFMQEALYAPGLGYYAAGARKFGPDGDFVTAPEVSPLFGYVLARQVAGIIDETRGDVLEAGAGSGRLAVAMLERLGSLGALPDRYCILEVSADLRERQEAHIKSRLPTFADRIEWLDRWPESFSGVVIANEVLDAMPVERFRLVKGNVQQLRVVASADGFDWSLDSAPAMVEQAVRQIEDDLGAPLPDGFESEVAPGSVNWVQDAGGNLGHGALLLIDYGVSRREYYAAERSDGWLRCHFRHHAHNDPLVYPGIQDITSWVDFTAIAEAGAQSGLDIGGYTTQGQFLLHGGMHLELDGFTELSTREQAELSGQVKMLTLPAEMGENFKVMALCRGDVSPPPAFAETDLAHRL